MFGHKSKEVTGDSRKLLNEKLHDLGWWSEACRMHGTRDKGMQQLGQKT
jgi:hypothetical protein